MRVVAHRGFADRHAENTVGAVATAARRADAVEVDVRRCGSGELVVLHDETVDRVTGGTGRVEELSLSALRDLEVLDSGEPVPTFEEVLAAVPGDCELVVELKERGLAADALGLADDAGVAIVVASFHGSALEQAREAAPAAPRALLFADDPERNLERAVALECSWVGVRHDLITGAFVQRAHDAGLAVDAWTVTEAETATTLRRAGVDVVTVDDPAVLESR